MREYFDPYNRTFEEYLLTYGPRLFYFDGTDFELDSVGRQILDDANDCIFDPEAYPVEHDGFEDVEYEKDDGWEESPDCKKIVNAMNAYDQVILQIITRNPINCMTFADYFFVLLKRHHMTPSDLYKKVNVTRQVISRLNSDRFATVEKETAVKLALAMKLSYEEAQNFLHKGGYHLSCSIKKDLVYILAFLFKEYDLNAIEESVLKDTGKSFFVQRKRRCKTE